MCLRTWVVAERWAGGNERGDMGCADGSVFALSFVLPIMEKQEIGGVVDTSSIAGCWYVGKLQRTRRQSWWLCS
jgi:hypothetical protein